MVTNPQNPTQTTVPNPANPDTGMVFDSTPTTQALTVPTPQSTAPAPGPADTSGMTFDSQPTAVPITVPATTGTRAATTPTNASTAPVAAPAPAYAWSATPESSGIAESLERWAGNVQRDLMHGTDLTGIGAVLKKMGAGGLEKGVSPEVAKFMGSLPLGLMQATQGAAQTAQSGKRWEGTKNTIGGLLDAATMPAAIVGPETAELTAGGLDTAGNAIGKAASATGEGLSNAKTAIENAVSYKNIQPELQKSIRAVMQDVAKEAGVQTKDAASIRDVAENVANAIESKASGIYQQLDAASGGRIQRFSDALKNISRGIKEANGVDPETETALLKRQQEVQAARETALQQVKAAGLDPDGLIETANRLYRQAMSTGELSRALRVSTEGIPAQLAKVGSKAQEVVNVNKLLPRLNQLLDKGRLETALPGDALQKLYTAVQTSKEAAEGVHAVQKFAKWAAGATGVAGGIAGYQSIKHLFD